MRQLKIIHLSDLHLLHDPQEVQRPLLRSLIFALQQERQRGAVGLVAITGDVFNTVFADRDVEQEAFQFFSALQRALGSAPTVVIPGNHDRRENGVIGPHRADFFEKVAAYLAPLPHVKVLGFSMSGPLSALLPEEFGGNVAEVAALDSTRLLEGMFSAGGSLRPEDILLLDADLRHRQAANKREEMLPLILLVHHHLVPTPITDRGRIQSHRIGGMKRFAVERLLPWLVANGDHEELTMTALGAGTALSTLQALGRAVVVLHGHKHYATMRLLLGPHDDDGDVLVAGAGSAGLAESWQPTAFSEGAPIWPSFNALTLSEDSLFIERVRFSPRESGPSSREPMLSLSREGKRWIRKPLPPNSPAQIDLKENRAHFRVKPSKSLHRFDVEAERLIVPMPDAGLYDYKELIEGAEGCSLWLGDKQISRPTREEPFELLLPYHTKLQYTLRQGVCRTIAETHKAYQTKGETYEWLSLMNRYDAQRATLCVEGLPRYMRVFGSATDLGTGEERPIPLVREGQERLLLEMGPCRARTLLRIYWTLS